MIGTDLAPVAIWDVRKLMLLDLILSWPQRVAQLLDVTLVVNTWLAPHLLIDPQRLLIALVAIVLLLHLPLDKLPIPSYSNHMLIKYQILWTNILRVMG